MMLTARLLAVLVWSSTTLLPGQPPPGQRIQDKRTTPGVVRSDIDVRLSLASKALAAGDNEEASQHFLSVLGVAPTNRVALRGLLTASKDNADDQQLWATRFWLACLDERGKFRPDKETLALLPDKPNHKPAFVKLADLRVAAVQELAKFAAKLKTRGKTVAANGMFARWASDLAWRLLRDAPGLRRGFAHELQTALDRQQPDYQLVLKDLRRVMNSHAAKAAAKEQKPADPNTPKVFQPNKSWDIAMRAACILSGLGAQANFKDLKGPKPPAIDGFMEAARAARNKLRSKLEAAGHTALTVDQLRAMGPADRTKFTKEHATWANPGIALSPNGRYVVETICGHQTLLGAAATVEHHHDRLVSFFGGDPFKKQPGIVRIVPEADGLEAEDAPFWWAGGFQRGNLTTVKFSWSSIAALGSLLTHELTHRFDGAFHAFLPSWLSEGRAVWTGQSYRRIRDPRFVENAFRPGSAQSPFTKGYGGEAKLKKLLAGTIEDYRDNYSAGYALFVYLKSWQKNGKPLFADRLSSYMKKGRGGRSKPVQWFVANFADGKDGRPKGLAAFAKGFRTFLHGCYRFGWGEKVAWLPGIYNTKVRRDGSPVVMDEPTWSWRRVHAEPWFGQGHAAAAGQLFAELNMPGSAVAALAWSLQTDGWHAGPGQLLVEQLNKTGDKDGAWVANYEVARRFRTAVSAPKSTSPLLKQLPKVRMLIDALARESKAAGVRKHLATSQVLAVQHNEIGSHLGFPPITAASPAESNSRYPRRDLPGPLGRFGWVDDLLTNHEERRVKNLWYETKTGDLHVGRNKPKKNTGLKDRRAHQRHTFVRAAEWQEPGVYVFRAKVHFTTSFASGAIVLGHSRRDRNIRLGFTAGDFLYSIGRSSDKVDMDSVRFHLQGLWSRDVHFDGRQRMRVGFDQPTNMFDLEVLVDGPAIFVKINGKLTLTLCTPDRSPVAGHIGIAMSQGAIRLQEPSVQRLDRGVLNDTTKAVGLSLGKGNVEDVTELYRRPTTGLPRSPNGTVIIWMPDPGEDSSMDVGIADLERCLQHAKALLKNPLHYPQAWAVAVPKTMSDEDLAGLGKELEKLAPKRFQILKHEWQRPFILAPWALFVDGEGVLRKAGLIHPRGPFPGGVQRWARRYRSPQF